MERFIAVHKTAIREESSIVAENDWSPSGGTVAAKVAELAASLACAAADQSRAQWPEAGGACAQAQALGRRVKQLGEDGAGAYAIARRALAEREPERGSDSTSEDQAKRDWRLGVAVKQAAESPLQLAASAADLAELAGEIAARAADDVRADAVVAALLAASAARAAARLVKINLAVGDGQPALVAGRYAEAAAAAAAAADALEL